MRIIQLTPGTGNFYCGSCLHDNALVRALRARGHDALMVPLYLPFVVEDPALAVQTPIFLGGLSVFLAQKFPRLRRVPAWLNRVFSSPALLRQLARFAGMTSARDLGDPIDDLLLRLRQLTFWVIPSANLTTSLLPLRSSYSASLAL